MPPKKILPPPPQSKGPHFQSGEKDMATPPPSSPAFQGLGSPTIRSRSSSNTSDDFLGLTTTGKRGRIIGDSSDTSEGEQGPSKKNYKDIMEAKGKEHEEKLRYNIAFCRN